MLLVNFAHPTLELMILTDQSRPFSDDVLETIGIHQIFINGDKTNEDIVWVSAGDVKELTITTSRLVFLEGKLGARRKERSFFVSMIIIFFHEIIIKKR